MGRFNGNNRQGTVRQFAERQNFSLNAYGRGENSFHPQPIKDFNFAERVLYGRIDKSHNPIFLKTTNLSPLLNQPSEGPILQAVNFVADAFSKFVLTFESQAIRGRLDENDPYIFNIVPKKAHIGVNGLYQEYMTSLRNVFIYDFLTKERKDSIIDFNSFLKLFFQYILETAETIPITKTSFITSKLAGPLTSGLCIEIADLDASDDSIKEEFITSPNFGHYKLIARNHGFCIDKQAPWRLVADIASVPMLRFSAPYGATNERRVLTNYYSRPGGDDLTNIKRMAIDFYNTLVSLERDIIIPTSFEYLQRCGPKIITRVPMTIGEIITNYSDNFWIDKYIDIRYLEQKKPISSGALEELRKTSKNFFFIAPPLFTIYIINNAIKNFDNFQGSYAKRVLDIQNSETGEHTQPTY